MKTCGSRKKALCIEKRAVMLVHGDGECDEKNGNEQAGAPLELLLLFRPFRAVALVALLNLVHQDDRRDEDDDECND